MKKILLNNEIEMPIIGIGTWPLNRLKLLKVVFYAIKTGYKSIDTSSAYGNEKWLGRSLKILRTLGLAENVFITTKLSNSAQRTGDVRAALKKSMNALNVKSVDLYLMHWPNPNTYLENWKKMEELYKEGLVKAIGVCNFHQHHLEQLLDIATVHPAVNQVELHPLLNQNKLRNFCSSKGIAIEAYSPVARMHPKLIQNKTLEEIAANYNKTVPQIILRWDVQHNIITIPKSSSLKRLKENINIFDFELSEEEMKNIDSLNENFRVRHNPDTADFTRL